MVAILGVTLVLSIIAGLWYGVPARRRLREAQERLAARERDVADMILASSEAFVSFDANGAITTWGANAEQLFGWDPPYVMGKNITDTLIAVLQREAYDNDLNSWRTGTTSAFIGHRVGTTALHRDGHEFSVDMMIWARRNGGYNAFISEVASGAPGEPEVLDAPSTTPLTDPLTSLGNRQLLEKDLAIYEGQVARYGLRSCIALIDIDNFKRFNDRYGRERGDEVIVAIAEQLASRSRSGDAVYRVGGDEFICLLPEQTLETGAVAVNRMRRSIAELAIPDEDSPTGVLTVSTGMALLDAEHLKASAELMKDAEDSLSQMREGETSQRESDGTDHPMPWS
ncbi:MAG: sensor domain-containing diguanylate cyclase [Acidimicrobiales bacterium]|jgi:diguanylate cyclase (GGDEF)-like protein/PAS domain S-box-containing protein